jgi:hypothetical protein
MMHAPSAVAISGTPLSSMGLYIPSSLNSKTAFASQLGVGISVIPANVVRIRRPSRKLLCQKIGLSRLLQLSGAFE